MIPVVSLKSKELQQAFAVRSVRSLKRKLMDLGVPITEGEYIVLAELEEIVKSKQQTMSGNKELNENAWIAGTSFEDYLNQAK